MSIEITGSPEPEVAAAIIAALESVLRSAPSETPPDAPAWLMAGIRDNLRSVPAAASGVSWRTAALP